MKIRQRRDILRHYGLSEVMLTITLNVKPLSVNEAFQGRRFSTPAKKAYEGALGILLPNRAIPGGPYYRIAYDFHLKNFSRTDWDNLIKVLQDSIVKRGIITDDRLIVDARVRKFPAKVDKIVVRIEGCELDMSADF